MEEKAAALAAWAAESQVAQAGGVSLPSVVPESLVAPPPSRSGSSADDNDNDNNDGGG